MANRTCDKHKAATNLTKRLDGKEKMFHPNLPHQNAPELRTRAGKHILTGNNTYKKKGCKNIYSGNISHKVLIAASKCQFTSCGQKLCCAIGSLPMFHSIHIKDYLAVQYYKLLLMKNHYTGQKQCTQFIPSPYKLRTQISYVLVKMHRKSN